MDKRVMGIDAGLTTGCCVMEGDPWRVIYTDVLATKKESKKRGIYVTDDDMRRIKELLEFMYGIYVEYQPALCIAELAMGGAKDSNAAKGMAISKTVVTAFAWAMDLPILRVNPDDIKKCLGGSKSASKVVIETAVTKQFPYLMRRWGSKSATSGFRGDFEHVADAIGAVITSEDDAMVKIVRGS